MSDDNNFQNMMQNFMKNAKQIQEGLSGAYQQMAQKHEGKVVEGLAGGDMVKATVNYKLEVQRIDLKPEILKEDVEVIGELVAAAVNTGMHKAKEAVREEMMAMSKQMGTPDISKEPEGAA